MAKRAKGTLIIVGGGMATKGDRKILVEIAESAQRKQGALVILTVATRNPEVPAAEYPALFEELGVEQIETVDVRFREEAHDEARIAAISKAATIFFTGGDQLRITSHIGDSPLYQCIMDRYHQGATVAGSSAGAAVMPETMLISGPSDESFDLSALGMAPGLGLIKDVVIDSHFAERGRLGRILGAIVQNPRNLGVGIDEDTAIVVQDGAFSVLGSGAVYIADAGPVTYSSITSSDPGQIVTMHDIRLHVLADGDEFDLDERRPIPPDEDEV